MPSRRQMSKCSRVLRLDGLVGGDYQDHRVNPAHAGEHVFHESFVAGNIHKAQPDFAQIEVSKADVN